MSLPKRLKAVKTSLLNTGDGKHITVDSLSAELQAEFALVDKMKEDLSELLYRTEVMSIAVQAKSQDLARIVSQQIQREEASTAAASVDVDAKTAQPD